MAFKVAKDVVSTSYDKQGYERCDALFANPLSSDRASWRDAFDTDPLASMDRAILGMRFKEWKPIVDSNNTLMPDSIPSLKPDRSYCYLFNSNDSPSLSSIQDPFLQGMKCSLDDVQKLGDGREFITNIFPDNNQDAPHASRFTYNKCVYEIDPSRMNSNNLASFWKSLSDAECEAYKAKWESIIRGLDLQIVTASSNLQNNKRIRDEVTFAFSNLKSYWPEYASCMATQSTLGRDLANVRTQQSNLDCSFQGRHKTLRCGPSEGGQPHKTLLDERLTQVNATFNNKKNQRSALNATATDLGAQVSTLQGRSNDLSQRLKQTSDDYAVCSQIDLPSLQARTLLVNQNIAEVTARRDQTRDSVRSLTSQNTLLTASNASLARQESSLQDQIAQQQAKHIACMANLERLNALANRYKEEYERYWKLNDECTTELHNYTQRRNAMKVTVSNLEVDKETWWAWCRKKQTDEITNVVTKIEENITKNTDNASKQCDVNSADMNSVLAKRLEKLGLIRKLQDTTQAPKTIDDNFCINNISQVLDCCR